VVKLHGASVMLEQESNPNAKILSWFILVFNQAGGDTEEIWD